MNPFIMLALIMSEVLTPRPLRPERGPFMPGRHALACAALLLGLLVCGPARAEHGIASVYDEPQPLACGGRLNTKALTAAHKTLPCGTRVQVCTKGGRCVVVRINDRGPYIAGRIIDLTPASAARLGFSDGLKPVTIKVL